MALSPLLGMSRAMCCEQSAGVLIVFYLKNWVDIIHEWISTFVALFIHGDTRAVARMFIVSAISEEVRTLSTFTLFRAVGHKCFYDIGTVDGCRDDLRIE